MTVRAAAWVLGLGLCCGSCAAEPAATGKTATGQAAIGQAATGPATVQGMFVERALELGLDLVHTHYGTGEKYMPENMGPGVAILDFDFDGRLDILVATGGPLHETPSSPATPLLVARLFRQNWKGGFEDVSERVGLSRASLGSGMGVAYADLDGDGALELFLSRFGESVLLRGETDGHFSPEVGFQPDSGWGTGAGFADLDGDLDLDLFEAHYVDFSLERHLWCGDAKRSLRAYCHPDVYGALPDRLYVHEGDRWVESAESLGVPPSAIAKGLGVAFEDFDGDGRVDVLVANDSTRNQLYIAGSGSRFVERGLLSGIGFNGAGAAEASMGIGLGDLDHDGHTDVLLTHLDQETHTLYSGGEGALFEDVTERRGLAAATLPWVGFGTAFLDVDHDADLDVIVANGHIIDNIELFDPSRSYRQPLQLFLNDGRGRLSEATTGLDTEIVGRGLATGDLDRDGDLDVVVTQNNDRALVLLNALDADKRVRSLSISLRGGLANTLGLGSRLSLESQGRVQQRTVASGASYLSQSAPTAHFGLGDPSPHAAGQPTSDLLVTWPSGIVRRYLAVGGKQSRILFEND